MHLPVAEQLGMSVETVLLDFRVTPCLEDAVYVRDVATVATCVAESLRQVFC